MAELFPHELDHAPDLTANLPLEMTLEQFHSMESLPRTWTESRVLLTGLQ